MKYGMRKPSLRKSVAARTSAKRMVRNASSLKAPRVYGWLTNPRKAAYNRVYNRTTFSLRSLLRAIFGKLMGDHHTKRQAEGWDG